MELKDKTAVVTGGSRGIGRATADALIKGGCRVVICGKNRISLDKAKKDLGADAHLCDVSKLADIKRFSDYIKNKYKKIDMLVNNAGVGYYKNFSDCSEEEINETIDVNIRGLIFMAKNFLPLIDKDGIIINISSSAGKTGHPGIAVYSATKFAAIGFTEALAGELKGIKVIAVCPGGVDTDMYRSMAGHGAAMKPEHIAAKILDICTRPEKYKSGSSVNVYHITDAIAYTKMRYFGRGNYQKKKK